MGCCFYHHVMTTITRNYNAQCINVNNSPEPSYHVCNPLNAEIFFNKPWRTKGLFKFGIIINVIFSFFCFIWITMLWVYGHHKYFNSFSAGTTNASVCISEELLHFLHIWGLEQKFLWNYFNNNNMFFSFAAHFKSFSSTASRELRQQFPACSGWRWQWQIQAW